MGKPNFERAQNTATELLIKQELDGLIIDVRNFVFERDITIESMQNYCKLTGVNVSDITCDEMNECYVLDINRSKFIILYNEDCLNYCRTNWGIAHEIGHIYLGHNSDSPEEEIEAHFFAAQLLMPEIVLIEICKRNGALYVNDIYNMFNVSLEASCKRIDTLNKRFCYSAGPNDKLLLKKMLPFIAGRKDIRNSGSQSFAV